MRTPTHMIISHALRPTAAKRRKRKENRDWLRDVIAAGLAVFIGVVTIAAAFMLYQ